MTMNFFLFQLTFFFSKNFKNKRKNVSSNKINFFIISCFKFASRLTIKTKYFLGSSNAFIYFFDYLIFREQQNRNLSITIKYWTN